jgi:hypothetical protein
LGDISQAQEQMKVNQELGTRALEQVLRDQSVLAKQLEATGQVVAKLTLDQMGDDDSETMSIHTRPQHQKKPVPQQPKPPPAAGGSYYGHIPRNNHHHTEGDSHSGYKHVVPKLSFPEFHGRDPKAWRHRCEDFFQIYNVPYQLWVTSATMHMKDNAGRWAEVQRLKGALSSWEEFMAAVEAKFGAYDYPHALNELLELRQTGSVEEYVSAYESLQFVIEMHNTGYDNMFFITQFTRGLKPEIAVVVQSQLPQTMETAVRIAKVQEQLLDKGKLRYTKQQYPPKTYPNSVPKLDSKVQATAPTQLSKERQKRDFCRANNLCFYCSEPFDSTHLAKCAKRPRSHMNAIVVNDLDVNLTDEVLQQLDIEDALDSEFCKLSLNAIAGTDKGALLVQLFCRHVESHRLLCPPSKSRWLMVN